jgi:hypothetical protein
MKIALVRLRLPRRFGQQIGKLVIAKLAVFPANFDFESSLEITCYPIGCPDDNLMELESLG